MINLSTKGRYAVRILVNLARADSRTAPVRAKDIAEAEGLSVDYAEQLLIKLKAAGFVRSQRGKRGGFLLTRSAEEITVAEVLAALEGELCLVGCAAESCTRRDGCPTKPLWDEAGRRLRELFAGTTIGQLARVFVSTPNYQI
ncbi:MAG: Rrf2 family transcriptional regulator [Kiritimatiellae bacterium]|nr:Rrf2 family transcriptional regulator [Kiritimatiellia bacterium]